MKGGVVLVKVVGNECILLDNRVHPAVANWYEKRIGTSWYARHLITAVAEALLIIRVHGICRSRHTRCHPFGCLHPLAAGPKPQARSPHSRALPMIHALVLKDFSVIWQI